MRKSEWKDRKSMELYARYGKKIYSIVKGREKYTRGSMRRHLPQQIFQEISLLTEKLDLSKMKLKLELEEKESSRDIRNMIKQCKESQKQKHL